MLVVGILVPLIVLGIHFSQPGNPENATGPNIDVPGYTQPKKAPFTAQRRREIAPVLRKFILTAVDRQDVGSSWDISAPSLREGFSRRQWNRGDLPVVPYPALDRGLGQGYVEYSYTDSVGMEVYLFPKPGSGYSQLTADVELVKGKHGNWQVDYWMPKKFHGPPSLAKATPAAKEKAKANAKAAPTHRAAGKRQAAPAATPDLAGPAKPSNVWWIVPIALLSLIVLVPIGFGVGSWYRNRRAQRDYLRSSGRA